VIGHRRAGGDDRPCDAGRGERPDEPEQGEEPVAANPLDHRPGQETSRDRRDHPDRPKDTGGHDPGPVEHRNDRHDGQRRIRGDAEHPGDAEPADAVVGERLAQVDVRRAKDGWGARQAQAGSAGGGPG
jgi:hypothetical protein